MDVLARCIGVHCLEYSANPIVTSQMSILETSLSAMALAS